MKKRKKAMKGEEQKNKEEERSMKGKEEQKKRKEEIIKDIDGDKSTNRGKKRKNEQADIHEKKKKPCTTDEEMKSLDNARAKLQELSNRARTLIAETVESSSFVEDGYLYEIKTVSRKYKL
ncbi:hypothetical protein DPMN_100890 [Dreissena polymorpha]|uniref:Uncharacterized protein n=1 Tax=Dreissena polymorpha TaxID=45954 RepID=A0A9D4R7U6_DREPO|nr:hypothetical protein DPMN_100890 [Dreissena polymorpha]